MNGNVNKSTAICKTRFITYKFYTEWYHDTYTETSDVAYRAYVFDTEVESLQDKVLAIVNDTKTLIKFWSKYAFDIWAIF